MRRRKGVTLIELMITMIAAVIIMSAVGVMMVDGQNGWNRMYDKAYSDVVVEGLVLKNRFDSVIRKASPRKPAGWDDMVNTDQTILKVPYYSSASAGVVDRYAEFKKTDANSIRLVIGHLNGGSLGADISNEEVCKNVKNVFFDINGRTASFVVTLEKDGQKNVVSSSAFMHN